MGIQSTGSKLHWNYFIALERDLELASRYVEFSEENYGTHSIEFAHLLFAAASEVDVLAKLLCEKVSPNAPRDNINDYKAVILLSHPSVVDMQVFIPRYGLTLTPWLNWGGDTNPDWWRSYNNVKHERNLHFQEANLHNALNALAALLIFTFYYYQYELSTDGVPLPPRSTTAMLLPTSTLLYFDIVYYDQVITTG